VSTGGRSCTVINSKGEKYINDLTWPRSSDIETPANAFDLQNARFTRLIYVGQSARAKNPIIW
jgi:hypothetical protein